MFAQPLKSLPLRGGKKTASSLAPQATDEGGRLMGNIMQNIAIAG